jgi:hypothetical protein
VRLFKKRKKKERKEGRKKERDKQTYGKLLQIHWMILRNMNSSPKEKRVRTKAVREFQYISDKTKCWTLIFELKIGQEQTAYS